MFRGVISREHGEPWGPTGMTTARWLTVPAVIVPIDELILTQPGIRFEDLWPNRKRADGDSFPHVIQWEGNLYLEDGHHRVVRAALNGARHIIARKITVD